MEEDDGTKEKGGINLDWDKLLPAKNVGAREEEPPLLVVVPDAKMPGLTATMAVDGDECEKHPFEELRCLSDNDLKIKVERLRGLVHNPVLRSKDGGEKVKASLKRHENELERRQSLGPHKDDDGGCKEFIAINRPKCIDISDSCWKGDPPSRLPSQSKAARCFSKFNEKKEPRIVKAFEKELSTLIRSQHLKMRPAGHFTSRGRHKRGLSSRETTFQSSGYHSGDIGKKKESNRDKKGRRFSDCSRSADAKVSGFFEKRLRPCLGRSSSQARHEKGEHVVLVDVEELEAKAIETQEDSFEERLNTNAIIYYPSRDDPEAVEISYSDMKCLAPGKCLSSTIMNFYTRHLQSLISPPDGESCSFHFFNTYFYKKLKDAVMSKGMEETSFAKFRRWWKGVNIFEKAYVLLPIHEDAHWSLVIICIPDEEDESGPIILHLDSLGLHSSRAIFSNIKRFLIEEWKILKEDVLSGLLIADKIWEKLPRSIEAQVMEVPRQRNDYDCGLFVLIFMKKFIDEAPKRLRKQDFPLFGKQWFNPGEASSLRYEIRSLLKGRFKKSREDKNY